MSRELVLAVLFVSLASTRGARAEPTVRVYGLVKPTVVVGNAHDSIGQSTFVAPTAAGNPVMFADPDAPAASFQLQQSRLGVKVGEGQALGGTIEIDFVHFEQSSPVQQAFPRLRIAQVEWSPAQGHTLTLGQGWDLWSPLVPYTFELVGAMFQAGNGGFMRNQAIWQSTIDNVELGAALGMAFANPSPSFTNLELGLVPSVALRMLVRGADATMVGFSVIGSAIRFVDDDDEAFHRPALGAALSFEGALGPLALRAEGYSGMNLANTATITLAQGNAQTDVFETGGFVSVKLSFLALHALTAGLGGAFVANPDDLAAGYVPATATAPRARAPAQGPGIERNANVRVGYVLTPMKGLSFVVEPSVYLTRHQLLDGENVDADRRGVSVELGARFDF